jgi:hypothetical protein
MTCTNLHGTLSGGIGLAHMGEFFFILEKVRGSIDVQALRLHI